MNAEQFTFWLQGYLDAKPPSSEVSATIQEKLKEVKPEPKTQFIPYYVSKPVQYPYTWCSNTLYLDQKPETPQLQEFTITC